jgi:hypothetical protein
MLQRHGEVVDIFTLHDIWQQKVMIAILRRYGLKPYRYRGQRYTTVAAIIDEPRQLPDTVDSACLE